MIRAPIPMDAVAAEPYRSLRTTLGYSRLPEGRRVVLFTSARRGEGKSTTAANFAAVCAYAERQTLLVNADLRSPQLDEIFGTRGTAGLAELLRAGDGTAVTDLARPTSIAALDYVPAGGAVGNAAEILSRPALADLVGTARSTYQWVVIDSPPLLPIADAAIVSRFVDGVVLVVDVSKTPIEAARRAKDLLRAVDAPLVGLVANRSRAKSTAYGYGRYPG